jgi:spermidine synthase
VLGAVAGFFAGLALGAFVLDRPIRRARSPRTAYVLLEAVIGLWGLICIWLLPVAGRALSPLRHRACAGPALGGQLCTADVGAVTRNRGNGWNVDSA